MVLASLSETYSSPAGAVLLESASGWHLAD